MKKPPADFVGRGARQGAVVPRSRRAVEPNVIGQARGWVSDQGGSLWVAGMLWLLIVYQVVPPDYFQGELPKLEDMVEPSLFFRSVKLGLIAASCCIVAWRAGLAWLLFKSVNRMFLACLVLIPLSVAWSIEPSATFARAVTLSSSIFVCYAFVLVAWHPQRMQNVVRPLLTGLLVGSVFFAMLFPDLAIETGEGTLKNAWRGLTHQKNSFGLLASGGTIFWLHAFFTKERNAWPSAAGALLSFICVLLSRSSSSVLSTTLTMGFMMVLLYLPGNMRRYMPLIVGTFTTVVVVYAMAVLDIVPGLDTILTPVAELFGKDTTFSNRSFIWSIIKEHIQLHPALGTGYGGYWIGPVPTSPSYEFLARMNFYPTESHNGYIEVANDLGFVGLIACLGYLMFFVRQCLRLMRIERNQAVLYLCLFFQQAIANLSESYWLQIGFGFTIMTLATFATGRAFLDHELQAHFGARVSSRPGR